MLNYKDVNSLILCFSIGVCFTNSMLAQQTLPTNPVYQQPVQGTPVYRAPVQQPLYQPQYPNRIINGQIIGGQPINNGQIINGQPINGQQIIGQPNIGQPIQNGNIIPPIVQGGTAAPMAPTPATRLQPTPAQLAARKAEQEKMIGLETKVGEQAKKIEFLVDENVRLSEAVDGSSGLKLDNQRLQREIEKASSELISLRNKPASNSEEMESQQQEKIQELTRSYQQAAQQNERYANQLKVATEELKTLGQENTNAKNELTRLRNAGAGRPDTQAELSKASTKIGELSQENQTLAKENVRIQGLYDSISANTDELSQQNQTLTAENTRVQALIDTMSTDNKKYEQRMTVLASENEGLVSSLDESRSTTALTVHKANTANRNSTSATDSRVAELMTEHRNLIALRDAADLKNKQLAQKLSDLKGTVVALKTSGSDLGPGHLGVKLPAASGSTAKFSPSKWLIPFFLVGLGVALYVFLIEERNEGVKTVTNRDRRDR